MAGRDEAKIRHEEAEKLKGTVQKLDEENLRLRTEFTAKIRQLHTLNDVARALNSVLNLDILFRLIVSLATQELGAERGSLMILEKGALEIKAAAGLSEEIRKKTRINIGQGISGRVVATGKPLLVKNREELDKLKTEDRGSYGNDSFIIAPIMIDRKCTGVINITSKKTGEPFDEEDLNFLETLANHAAIAIRNASIHQRAQLMAVTDGLTSLFNHRFFQERLVEEVERCKRYGETGVSLLMIDIDDFKLLNDAYGHTVGDQVLKKIASIIRQESRVSDIVSRYGGEEFSVILPETSKEVGLVFAERLRSRVARQDFSTEDLKLEKRTSLSIGISHFPTDAGSPSQLIELADKALYVAKQSGKNQVRIYEE